MPAIVLIRDLDFAYGASQVLKQINLSVERGTTLGLIGPNGGGKTTLVKLMLGLLDTTRGSIEIGGVSPRAATRAGNVIGYLPQNPGGTPDFPISVRQIVRLGLAGKTGMLRAPSKQDLDFVDSLIERVGAADYRNSPVGALSGGQLQRVYIARALAASPKLLILDEPTTGIDRRGQQQFIEFIQSLRTDLGLTVIFVSHDLRAVSSISDRIACLNGTLHYHDVPEHLPADLVYRMFACDLEAIGIGTVCNHPEHQHPANAQASPVLQLNVTNKGQ